jgi:diacylglycerol kinase (ATP)
MRMQVLRHANGYDGRTQMQVILIHNTGAGDGDYDQDALVSLISDHGHHVQAFAASDNWQRFARSPVELVVAAGGDGTVADVARHVAGSGVPIGVLPLGTANNVASALGIAGTPIPELVASWTHATRRPFDSGRAVVDGQPSRFIESVGFGLLAESIAEITHGSAGYVDRLSDAAERMDAAIDVLRQTLRRLQPTHVELIVDGQPLSGDYLMVEVMNFGCAGPNLVLADAEYADGLFDVVVAEIGDRAWLIEELPLYQRGYRPSRFLRTYQGRHVILNAAGQQLHLDDELKRCRGPVELALEHQTLTFLV